MQIGIISKNPPQGMQVNLEAEKEGEEEEEKLLLASDDEHFNSVSCSCHSFDSCDSYDSCDSCKLSLIQLSLTRHFRGCKMV